MKQFLKMVLIEWTDLQDAFIGMGIALYDAVELICDIHIYELSH